MDVEEALRKLRAVRRFRDAPLRDEDLRAILDAGRRAGSSKNLQRWHFIVVRDRATLTELAKVGPFAGHLAGGAAAIALITPDPAGADMPLSVTWDLGRAAQNMTLAAWARGIGSVPATVYDHDLCRSILGYPPDQHCEYLLNFGYPAEERSITRPARIGGRRPLVEVVYYERWGATAPSADRS
ncbi:MAG: nitroreductase family protein [Chloroflexota bacterium]|nr:nitroreductase family protein [Chloroflexota bacterium]